jgi:hypothetical protein
VRLGPLEFAFCHFNSPKSMPVSGLTSASHH